MTETATQPPDLNDTAAQWQWALDAAARALEADRAVLRPADFSRETHHLTEERRETALLQGTSDELIARAESAASASMREQHDAGGIVGDGQLAV